MAEDIKYKRSVVDDIIRFLDARETIVIYGARQVGKTTLLEFLMENHLSKNAFYFDLEMPNLLELCNSGPQAVYQYLLERGADEKQTIFLLLDEIQYLKNPTNFIKLLHDHFRNVKLLVSGSSTFEIKKKFGQSLAGRTVSFELYPLSFEEFLVFKNRNYRLGPENVQAVNDELIVLAEEFIRFGGYPKIVLENDEEKKKTYLFQLINTYVRKDIRDIGNIQNISGFNRLLEIIASQSGQLLNVAELASTLQSNRQTISEYLDLLEKTFIIRRITPFHRNLRTELSKNPKIFLMDTGMMHLLWLKEFPKTILGNSFETFVFLELMKAGQTIRFWRTTNKQEIDFIITNKTIHAIEAKQNFQHAKTKNLKAFAKEYPCKTSIVGLTGEKNGLYAWELTKEIRIEKQLQNQ